MVPLTRAVLVCLALLGTASADAQTTSSMQPATLPLTGQEQMFIVQGGQPRKAPVSAVAGTAPPAPPFMERDGSNAILPTARDNIIYTPPSCDGFSAVDGNISIGSNSFSSASANFTAAAVGKTITIRKAGSGYFGSKYAISSGGSGHAVGDVVSFPDGTKIYVRSVVVGVVATFYPVALGVSTTNDATISQNASSGGGTGLILTPTWVRNNLVTTITGLASPSSVSLAVAASDTVAAVEWAYGTVYNEIAAALAANIKVRLPNGECGIGDTINLPDEAVLLGQGIGQAGINRTTLLYLGPPGRVQMLGSSLGQNRLSAMTVGDFSLKGMGAATKGLELSGAAANYFASILTEDHTTVGFDIHPNADHPNFSNFHVRIRAEEKGISDLYPHGMWWGFPNHIEMDNSNDRGIYSDVALNVNSAAGSTAVPFVCGTADHNLVGWIKVKGPAALPGLDLLGANWISHQGMCRMNYFTGIDSGDGGLFSRAIGYTQFPTNSSGVYDKGNGEPEYVTEVEADFFTRESNGRSDSLWARGWDFNELTVPKHDGKMVQIKDGPRGLGWGEIISGPSADNKRYIAVWDNFNWRVVSGLDGGTKITSGTIQFGAASIPPNTTTFLIPGVSATTGINDVLQIPPNAGNMSFTGVRLWTKDPPTGTDTYTITVNKGPQGTMAATALTCQITGSPSVSRCSGSGSTGEISAGNFWNVTIATSATAAATGILSVQLDYALID